MSRPWLGWTHDSWRETFEVNTFAPFRVTALRSDNGAVWALLDMGWARAPLLVRETTEGAVRSRCGAHHHRLLLATARTSSW